MNREIGKFTPNGKRFELNQETGGLRGLESEERQFAKPSGETVPKPETGVPAGWAGNLQKIFGRHRGSKIPDLQYSSRGTR